MIAALPGRRMLKLAGAALAPALLCGALAGCSSVKASLPAAPQSLTINAVRYEYRIQPGDVIELHFANASELNEQIVVAPDGSVSFEHAVRLPGQGRTLGQLEDDYGEATKAQKTGVDGRPNYQIVLRNTAGARIYVLGEVATPGEILTNGTLTALQAVSRAGGLKFGAQASKVVLVRRDAENHPVLYRVNLRSVLNGTHPEGDVELASTDILYVPKDNAANLSTVFERVRNAIPFAFTLNYGNTNANF